MTAADSDLDRMLRAHRRPTGPVTDQMPKCWCCGRVLGTYSTRPWSRKCVNQCDKVILESEFLAASPVWVGTWPKLATNLFIGVFWPGPDAYGLRLT